jgi:hypothetical protein
MVMKLAHQPDTEAFTVPAGEFKAKCLRLMDESNEKQRKVGITKRGVLVGHFVPVPPEQKPFRSLFGRSPNIKIPELAEWMKMKAEWADDWEASTKKLAHTLKRPKKTKQ